MREESMERVVRVANNTTFAGFVRELELFPVTKLFGYTFEDWCTAANFSWEDGTSLKQKATDGARNDDPEYEELKL
ncbi:hypothetical protein GTA08_BOTSDO01957 [Botryosphaeria dothidea]|uniref:Uncharacterized protein n=1 Tax=Botryosphaeria dothidea TaxID=55169 RepID=A0A8H4IYJ6_9PEZI|nr:hypothetical protein GTA08_BOTSDO01957 [Botryosphaeria dothidea]